ncbi:MAG: hypothetical protein IJ837_01090 [Clostridia bacterium]|nr:hypothetical protein [Clostridia bacterium]
MEVVKNKLYHLVLGCMALVMLVLGILLVGGIIPSSVPSWVWAITLICCGISLVEMIIYFMFSNSEISLLLCKWLNLFLGIILLIVNFAGLCLAEDEMFSNFGAVSGWLSFVFVLFNVIQFVFMFAYFIFAVKAESEEKALRAAKRNSQPAKETQKEEKEEKVKEQKAEAKQEAKEEVKPAKTVRKPRTTSTKTASAEKTEKPKTTKTKKTQK